jgi:hypothetical protein
MSKDGYAVSSIEICLESILQEQEQVIDDLESGSFGHLE